MCDDKINVEVIGIRKGDTIIFFVDTDYYDSDDIASAAEMVQNHFPNNTITMLPEDMISEIKIFSEHKYETVEMPVAHNGINKNLSKIDWTNVELGGLNVGEMGL